MQIVFWLPRVRAKAGPAVRSVRKYGWRLRIRSGLVACAALIVALSWTYRTAEAQIKIVDVNFPVAPDALIEEVDSILNREMCLFEFRAEELTRQVQAALDELRANYGILDDAHRAKNVSDRDFKRLGRGAGIRLGALEASIWRIRDFPRCLNFVGSPPGRLKMEGDERPEIGRLVVEPKVSVGLVATSGASSYDSTGGQAPFNGDWSHSSGQLCGGVTLYPGFVAGPARLGFDFNVCTGSNTFSSTDTTQFAIMRHGPGDVALRSSSNAIIDTLFKAEIPLSNPQTAFDAQTQRWFGWFASAGIGAAFREQNLTLTSDQSFFGGGIPSISDKTWQAGLGVSVGLSSFVCPNCFAGNPVKVGVEGRARFFPSQSISLRSPVFGFTETGSTGSTTDYSALVTLSVPVGYGGDPISDRFGRRH
jgi:hypothetical protein